MRDLNDYIGDVEGGMVRLASCDAILRALQDAGFKKLKELPFGCLVGSGVLAQSVRTETLTDPGHFGNFAPGRFAWRFEDVELLDVPIPYRGNQGFFEVTLPA